MIYQIQSAMKCENCIKCGSRPVIEQTKKDWKVKCSNKDCDNEVSGPLVNLDLWNNKNKKTIDMSGPNDSLKHTA